MLRRPRVATVVLNFGDPGDTFDCLEALRTSTVLDQRLVVVDNGPEGPAHDRLRAGAGPGVDVVATGRNLGYAAGNNVGIRLALEQRPDFVWVVNPDLLVEPDTLQGLLRVAAEVPNAGVVGPRILNGNTSPRTVWFDGGVIGPLGATHHTSSGRVEARSPAVGLREVDYVTGACMLVRRRVLDRVGLIPEDYFLYFEETDFCRRVRADGWRLVVDDTVRATHHKRSSGRLPTPHYLYYMTRNRLLFASRTTPDGWSDVLADFRRTFLAPWRERVGRLAPDSLDSFDALVDLALEDFHAGLTGEQPLLTQHHIRETVRSTP